MLSNSSHPFDSAHTFAVWGCVRAVCFVSFCFTTQQLFRILMRSSNYPNDMQTFEAHTSTHSLTCTHREYHMAHQTPIPHVLLSQVRQHTGFAEVATTGWLLPEGLQESDLQQYSSSAFSKSPWGEDLQAAVDRRWGRCWPLKIMGGLGGMTWLLFGSHALWHNRVTLLQVIQMIEDALSICSPDTKTHGVVLHGMQQNWCIRNDYKKQKMIYGR